jgi:hypothetical protein
MDASQYYFMMGCMGLLCGSVLSLGVLWMFF